MTEVETTLPRQRWRFYQWPVVWSITAIAIVLGLVGFAQLSAESPRTILDLVYGTLQLFVLGGKFDGLLNWQLEVARFLAPTVTAYTAAQALIVLFREQLQLLRLRFTHNHVVVCGLGRTGFKVAADLLRSGRTVVVIEVESENDWIRMCEDLGGTVLIGDATEEMLLRQARVEHAHMLVVVCGSDGTNVEAAIRACELKRAMSRGAAPSLECHVHIVDEDLRTLFKEHRVFTDTGDRFNVTLFNVYDASARHLLQKYPLDRERIGPEDPRTVHFIVVGLGQMGESVVLQAARLSHFANGRRLRVTVVDREAESGKRRFQRRHPQIDVVCDLKFLAMESDDPELLGSVATSCGEKDTLVTVVVCFDGDVRCLSFALALLPKVKPSGVPILIRMTTDGGLATLLDTEITASRLAGLVKPFPLIGLASDRELVLQQEMDACAIAIHNDYLVHRRREGRHSESDPSLRSWEELDEDFKDSNRQQADHVALKLRALGLVASTAGPGDPATEFTPAEVETLARMEHARWNAERFLVGWSYAPGPRNLELKTSPYLVAWDVLPEEIKEYDRLSVRNIPHLVRMSGRQIYRQPNRPA